MRTILLTGASGLIGSTLTKYFLNSGDYIIAITRSKESLDKLRSEFHDFPKQLLVISVDLTSENAISHIMQSLNSLRVFPDSLINNARDPAFLRVNPSTGMVDRSNFIGEFLLDVVVPYEMTMNLTQQLSSKLKSVVNIGSQYGLVAPNLNLYDDPSSESFVHYGVAKAGIIHLTKELSVRLAPKDVRVNCVAFGGVEGRADSIFRDKYSRLCPSGRMLNQNDLCAPVDLLLSSSASGITGHTLVVDGGWSIW